MSAFERRLIAETRARLAELEQEAGQLHALLEILDTPAATRRPRTGEEGPTAPELAEAVAARPPRKLPTKLPNEVLRDWVAAQAGEFSTKEVAERFDVVMVTAGTKLRQLAERRPPVVEVVGQRRHGRWRYIPPAENTNGPTTAPRGERLHIPGGIPRGVPVPLTGQIRGPSGRPGTDRKVQALGHRIKRQRQGS